MRQLPDSIHGADAFQGFLGDLAAVGVEPVARGGIRYAVIAARSNPRWWLLPVDNRRAAAAGLEMLQPISLPARLAKAGARALVRFGPHILLGKGYLRLSGMPNLGETFNGRASSVAYFTGTDGPHRKSSMQIMDRNAVILGYAKISRAPHVRPYLRNEATILGRLAAKGLRSADIPCVQAYLENAAVTMVVTNSIKSATHTAPLALGSDHLAFLEELRSHGEANCAGALLDELAVETRRLAPLAGPDWTARIARILSSLRPYADSIPLCLCHGDFTPWNTFTQGKRLYVFDWEYARTDWPVGFDLTHFLLSTTSPAAQLDRLPELIKTLAEKQFHGDMTRAARALLLSLACHALFYLGRLQEVNATLNNWTDARVRAALIDKLLSQTATS